MVGSADVESGDVQAGVGEWTSQPGRGPPKTIHHRRNNWGDALYYWPDLDKETDDGSLRFFETFGKYPEVGDTIHRPLTTGLLGEFRVFKVKRQRDPPDQVMVYAGLVNRLEICGECSIKA